MANTLKHIACAAAIGLAAFFAGCGPSKPVLNVYTWSDYVDPKLIEEFEEQNNCKVVIDIFDSNEGMYAKLKAGGAGYDLVNPTSYMTKIMNDQGMLEKLDHSQMPNVAEVDKNFLSNSAIDKDMAYSVPYMIGFTCVAYNKEKLGEIPNTWDVFSNAELKGRMTLLNDMRETIGAALRFHGNSINTRDEKQIEEAKQQILKWKKNIATFDSEIYKSGISSGEYMIVQGYSGDLFQVLEESPNLSYMTPKEGMALSCDDWAIPVTAKNKELAQKFINFLCDPKIAARNMEFTYFCAPIPAARQYVSEKNRNHPGMFISEDIYKNGELFIDLGEDNAKYIKAWDEIKLAK